MIHNNIIIIRHSSGLKSISEAEVLSELTEEDNKLPRKDIHLDMRDLPIDGGIWDESQRYIINQAKEIRKIVDGSPDAKLLYFGLAEIPHIIALGGYLSDQYKIDGFNFNRDNGNWEWESNERTLEVEAFNLPKEVVKMSGEAIIRIELSSPINNEDIDEVVGEDRLADIRITLSDDRTPSIATTVKSANDVQLIRDVFRDALANLIRFRPDIKLIHLFISAPAPVCFVIGQELQLRNNVPIQTYRFRKSDTPHYTKAILISSQDTETATVKLDKKEIKRANEIRNIIWPKVLESIQNYAAAKKSHSKEEDINWLKYHNIKKYLEQFHPFPQLPPIWDIVQQNDKVDPKPRHGDEYGHTLDENTWQLSDPLLISLSRACKDDDELEDLIRLFLFHEYIHSHHSLTKYNVDQVGRFENCLEKIDYMADLYALIHLLDFKLLHENKRFAGKEKEFLIEKLDLIIRSTWAFIPGAKVPRWQVRRIRRLLNWYWRYTQVQNSEDLSMAINVLSQAPTVELVGPKLQVESGRIYMLMTDVERKDNVELALGIVLENATFYRRENAVNFNLDEVREAFHMRNHNAIMKFFLGVFYDVKQRGGALPYQK